MLRFVGSRFRFVWPGLIAAAIATELWFFAFPLRGYRPKASVTLENADESLSCSDVYHVTQWVGQRFSSLRAVDFRAKEFSDAVSASLLDRIDSHRVLITSSEARRMRKHFSSQWAPFLETNDCISLSEWIVGLASERRARLRRLVSEISNEAWVETWEIETHAEGTLKSPRFASFASSERELKTRLREWIKIFLAESSQGLLKAFQGDRKQLLLSTFDNAFFESKIDPHPVMAKSILSAIDPFSTYFSPTEFDDFYQDLAGSTSGVGLRVRSVPDGLFIQKIVEGSAAARSKKIDEEDTILSVDGKILKGMSSLDAKNSLKGTNGSTVVLKVRSASDPKITRSVRIIRRPFVVEDSRITLSWKTVGEEKKRIAVISIPSFYGRSGGQPSGGMDERSSADDLRKILQQLSRDKSTAAVVIDLRGNPGGYLEEAVQMAGFFLGNEPVVEVVEKGNRRILRGGETQAIYTGPLAVLLDEDTASASEVLAGALKDYQRAVLIGGRRSYGKGSVQKLFNLEEDFLQIDLAETSGRGVVKMTTSVFYSPAGHSPANGGVKPHFVLRSKRTQSDLPETAPETQLKFPEESPFIESRMKPALIAREQIVETRLRLLEDLLREDRPAAESASEDLQALEAAELDEAVSVVDKYIALGSKK